MADELKTAQMAHAAELYYEQNQSQQSIAKILGCSHSTVSRLLADARKTGVVQITIRRAVDHRPDLASQLRNAFGLREAVVVPNSGSEEGDLQAVGTAAAEYLLSIIADDMTVGVTWGNTLHHMVEALPAVPLTGVEVVQLSGVLGEGDPDVDGPRLAVKLADAFAGTCRMVPAPAIVTNAAMRENLMRQPQIKQALARAATADIMIQGIGALDPSMSSLERAGYIREADRKAARRAGAVGHVLARMIDAEGDEVGDYTQRAISIPLSALRGATWSVAISASVTKSPALIAALRGGYFNVVIIEEATAHELLRLREAAAA